MNSLDSYDYLQKTEPTLTLADFEPSISEISRLDRAILDAQASNSLAAEAIAHECAAQFYLEWGKEKIAVVYLQDAYDCYARSGSKLKTESLEQQYPQFLALINNMVDLSKIQVGKLELEITNVSVAELCYSSTTFVKHCAIQKQIQLDVDIPDRVGYIAVDLQRMHQVLINLLNQAIDSTPVGGMVKLVVTRARESSGVNVTSAIQFSVIDTSKEISTSPSQKAAQSVLPINSRRIGIGLMLVKPIVELHGVTLEFQSTISRSQTFFC